MMYPKPARGSLVLEKEDRDAEAATVEKREKAACRKRDVRQLSTAMRLGAVAQLPEVPDADH